jgi:hypothetical protein
MQVPDQLVLQTVGEGKKTGVFEFAVCLNTQGDERRLIRFIKLPDAVETQLLALVAEHTIADDLEVMQIKLDMLRKQLEITSGWGMEPGDVGYQPTGLPALNPMIDQQASASVYFARI